MHISSGFRTAFIALAALAFTSASALADSGTVSIRIVKAGFVIGGSGGSGVLHFHGRNYPLSIGGLSYGFTFGASETNFHGRVTNIRRPQDVEGVYGQAGAGAALVAGAQGVVLTNQNGAVLTLAGRQVGAIVSADLSGLALSLRR
jgi:lipid-binding SYLF domain-containing protein